jgi:6-phosphogluconolactonase
MKTKKYFYSIASLCMVFSFNSCSNYEDDDTQRMERPSVVDLTSEKGQNPDDLILDGEYSHKHAQAYLYTIGNDTGGNRVYIYKQNDNGDIVFQGMVSSGGVGNGMPLESQGAVVVNRKNDCLYVVNPGSNTISSFAIGADGGLTLMHTANTNGITPVSITIHEDKMYVVHSGSSTISGFLLASHGMFSFVPASVRELSTTSADPAQIAFSPNGNYLYVTERATNQITRFMIKSDGLPTEGVNFASMGNTPFGFDFARENYMIVSNAEMGAVKGSTVSSYSGINTGSFDVVSGAIPNNQTAACWLETTEHGRYALVTNTGTDNLSSYYINSRGRLYLINESIPSGGGPIDIAIAENNISVFVLCSKDHTIQTYLRTKSGGLEPIGKISGVAAGAVGLASW